MNERTFAFALLLAVSALRSPLSAQTANTSPLPAGETVIGGHLHAAGDEVWSDQTTLYFNWRGNASTTYFWNLGQTSGKPIMTLKSNGNVGFGEDSPIAPIHLSGEGSAGELNLLIQNTGTNGARTFLSAFSGKSSIQTDKDFTICTNGGGWSDKMILTNAGSVGIGTMAPVTKLHIAGAVRIDGAGGGVIGSGNGSRLEFSSGTVTAIEENWGLNFIGNDQNPVKVRNAALLVGYTSNTAGYGTQGNLLVQGNVGIGTTAPDEKLTVNGVVHTKEVRVDMDVPEAPDYVFKADYDLRSLAEVEQYIRQHEHLPEIPSAQEMSENGLDLKEMNLLLLKKVEELTLYIISQQKQIDALKTPKKLMNFRFLRQTMKKPKPTADTFVRLAYSERHLISC